MLSTIVQNFSTRKFTFEDDASDVAGVINALSTTYGNFHYGHPERYFDAAMLWQPKSTTPVTRRIVGNDSAASDKRQMPSWSRLGWQGSLDFTSSWYYAGSVKLEQLGKWYKVGERLESLAQLYAIPETRTSFKPVESTPLYSLQQTGHGYHLATHFASVAKVPGPPTINHVVP